MRRALLTATALLLASWPAASAAAEEQAAAEERAAEEPTTEPPRRTRLSPREDRPWIERWTPEPNTTEVGVYGGLLVTSRRIELFEADFSLPEQGYRPFARVASSFGLRASFFPMRMLGTEIEAGAMPTRTEVGQPALLYTARGAVVAQLALWSVTPFVLVGGGLVGVTSDRTVVGNDVDAAMYVGGGVKVYVSRFIQVRLDVRDVVTARRGYEAGLSNNPEILLGVGMTLGRRRDLAYREPREPKPTSQAPTGIETP